MSGGRSSSDFSDPDINYYNLVESYMSSTREILNGYMTFERGLVRILNNRIIFRNIAPVNTPAGPVPVSRHAPLQRTSVQPQPQPQPQPVPLSQPQPPSTTATFIRYRLPLPSTTIRATRGITTPNASTISIFSPPPQSPPPPPPPLQPHSHTQSLSPIVPISSRINSYDWLNFIETNNITMNTSNINRRDANLTDFQEQRLQQQQRARQREQEQEREQEREREQDESGSNYISYDRVQMATKLIPFCTIVDPQNDICPISQIQFEEIDCIMQIKYCKHNFNPYSLFRWLDSNSTCPMCRYNLNAYSSDGVRPRRHNHLVPEITESESESESGSVFDA